MADAIYHFVWGTFCDWYVELVKGAFDDETRRVAGWAFDQILVMLHPLMPFITEELWAAMGERPYELIVARWPELQAEVDSASKKDLDWIIRFVREVRSARTELNVPPGANLTVQLDYSNERLKRLFIENAHLFGRLARVQYSQDIGVGFGEVRQGDRVDDFGMHVQTRGTTMQIVLDDDTFIFPLEGIIDVDAEKTRLLKGAVNAEKERDSLKSRLSNPNFTERAKPEAVEKARADHEAKAVEAERLRAALERLG
jgi:valyl-tRNA synthetase